MTLNQFHFAPISQVSSSLLSRRRGDITPLTAGTKISGSHNYFTSNGQVKCIGLQKSDVPNRGIFIWSAVRQQSEELAGSVSKLIDPQLADAMDMSDVQDEFSAVITKASVTLVLGLETKFDAEMAAMTRVP
ncbi:hypothetical protein LWI29_020243 [Acer saccharum]|uniref:Uncharacterized protein n=1 Tax=Acer saccharum TaxID=4024 RepID=A0AA39UJT2_ACESA|nr:hypothetical protein LWI29_020243 [Acer saccharum]